jgi:hypothetical protein
VDERLKRQVMLTSESFFKALGSMLVSNSLETENAAHMKEIFLWFMRTFSLILTDRKSKSIKIQFSMIGKLISK